MALDREAIAREVYGGGRVPATGFLPRALGLQYDAEVCGDLVPTTARVAEAREVLKRADVKLEGEKLPLYYSTGFGNDRLAAAAAQQWRAAFGVDVQPTALTPQAWLARATSVTSFDGPFTQGWDVQVASASRYFEVFTAGASGAGNLTGFASPTFERFLSDVRGAGDPGSISSDDEERRIAFRRAEERLCDDMPLIPVAYAQAHAVTRPSVAPARESGFLDVRGRLMLRELYVTSPS